MFVLINLKINHSRARRCTNLTQKTAPESEHISSVIYDALFSPTIKEDFVYNLCDGPL